MAYSGWYTPQHPQKYRGDPTQIRYRSLWERRFMRYLDENPNVLAWASEEIAIPYQSPVDGRIHKYFVDFWVQTKTPEGKIRIQLIEIKPKKQTRPPKKPKRVTPRVIQEYATWGVNQAKWKAARCLCENQGWEFMILTEDELL